MLRLKTKRYTKYIGKKQLKVAQTMAKLIFNCKGLDNAITNTDIIRFFSKKGIKLTPPEVRAYINFICQNYIPNLVGSGNGYYVTTNENDLRHAMRTLVSRAKENRMRAEILHTYIENNPPRDGQLRIEFEKMPDYFISGQLKINFK